MEKQLSISYSSAYLKYQLLKGAWLLHKQSIVGQLPMVYDFLENKIVVEDNQHEPKMTIPYSIQIAAESQSSIGRNVTVIPIMGSLMKKDYCGAVGMQTIVSRIKDADEAESVSGIILHIDSAGGTVDGTKELADTIKSVKKPIVAFADGLAASAAYWIGSSADKFIAKDTTTEVGSIGVVLSFVDNQKAMESKGYEFHDIFADQSSEKWKEMKDASTGDYSTIKEWTLNPLAAEFQEAVKLNRTNVNDKALKGRVYLAKQAKRLGLIDSIGNFDFALGEISKLIMNKNINVMAEKDEKTVKVSEDKSLVDKILAAVKPEIKDISEESKAEYEEKIASGLNRITELESENSELKGNIESYGTEKEKIENELKIAVDNGDIAKIESSNLSQEIDSLKSKLTENVAKASIVENDEDKLEIGKLSEEEASWAKDVSNMKNMF